MSRLLFLDFDGVMNCHEWCNLDDDSPRINRLSAKVLNRVISEHDFEVVVSSTWARHIGKDMEPSGFSFMLRTHGIRARVVGGINGHVTDPRERSANILQYAGGRADWLSIDDLPLVLPQNRFYRSNATTGLVAHDVHNIRKLVESWA